MSSTVNQITNVAGFPKPRELIEITGASALEAQDRAVLNVLYQHAHDSGHLTKPGAKWEIPAAALRTSRHESNDRLQDALLRLMQVVVHVPYSDPATGDKGRKHDGWIECNVSEPQRREIAERKT